MHTSRRQRLLTNRRLRVVCVQLLHLWVRKNDAHAPFSRLSSPLSLIWTPLRTTLSRNSRRVGLPQTPRHHSCTNPLPLSLRCRRINPLLPPSSFACRPNSACKRAAHCVIVVIGEGSF